MSRNPPILYVFIMLLSKGRASKKDSSIGAFLAGTSPLHLSPVAGRATLVIDMETLSKISGVRLKGQGLAGQGAIIIEADADGQGFVPGARCQLADDVTCNMSPRRISRLRLTLTGAETASYVIQSIEPFGDLR